METILVTAIGSFSATCVITSLKQNKFTVIGTDIYQKEWHMESYLCDKFYQCPYASQEQDYISFMFNLCQKEKISILIPLTDLEIDVFNRNRKLFEGINVILAMPDESTLKIARNKYLLFDYFKDDNLVASIDTKRCPIDDIPFSFPFIAKPYNGRSSEGLRFINNKIEFEIVKDNPDYIFQEKINGPIVTVDYVRNKYSKQDFYVPRYELLRTKNGAGISVKIFKNDNLAELVSYIGNKINVNGCICLEFIENEDKFYLIDINPRFSAGVAFSCKMGYDMVYSHLMCHLKKNILEPIKYRECNLVKFYQEKITEFIN